MTRTILAVDFHGVIHGHLTRGDGVKVTNDPPIGGALRFLLDAAEEYQIYVVSARFRPGDGRAEGLRSATAWLVRNGIPAEWITAEPDLFGRVVLSAYKPTCHLFIDDRAYQFNGKFPTLDEIATFRTWQQKIRPVCYED